MMCPPYMISPKRYRRSSQGTYKETDAPRELPAASGAPRSPLQEVRAAAHITVEPHQLSLTHRGNSAPGPAEAKGKGTRGCGHGCVLCSPTDCPCPHLGSCTLPSGFARVSSVWLKGRAGQDTARGGSPSLLLALLFLGHALCLGQKGVLKKQHNPARG